MSRILQRLIDLTWPADRAADAAVTRMPTEAWLCTGCCAV